MSILCAATCYDHMTIWLGFQGQRVKGQGTHWQNQKRTIVGIQTFARAEASMTTPVEFYLVFSF